MNTRCHENNPYGSWMKSYSSKQFTTCTQLIIETLNELTETIVCPNVQEQICLSFFHSAKFELMFFDAALQIKNQANRRIGDVDNVAKLHYFDHHREKSQIYTPRT